ncbi:alpha-xylosidase [Aestuariimicrobium kwangyangense]|uniref:alpha-xylosidase n=1 Tax=Aestuariimicrobium kwangyangense TaxID=396389 RepID=UPI0003B3A9AB|nr:alpha-xylosidase [Aestuariimicrobium kwangyangense]
MKFSDGYWMLPAGVEALRARVVVDTEVEPTRVVAHVADQPMRHRGDTLNRPLISVALDSPAEGIIGVTIEHFSGSARREPALGLSSGDTTAVTERTDSHLVLTSGSLRARIATTGEWHLVFERAVGDQWQQITSSTARSIALHTVTGRGDDDGSHVKEQLSIAVGEHFYGLGERFGPLVKNGQSVDNWNADGGTSSEQAYKNVPFLLSDRGYGILVESTDRVSWEVASEAVSRVQFSVPGQRLRYLLVDGPTPAEALVRYTGLAGRPSQVPAWSYGLWLSTSFTTNYDEQTVLSFVDGMAERGIPLSVFHFDCFWMRAFHWSDFIWDPATFPDPRGLLAKLHERGLKVCVWINPYIAQRSELFAEGSELGYLVRTPSGDVWQTDQWQAGMGLVDFTNPSAAAWFSGKLKALLDDGVDCFKTDFGERIPTEVVWHDGTDPQLMHNWYATLYNRSVHDLLVRERGQGEAVLFARSASLGGQQYPVHWGGDCESTFVSMAESLRGGLSLASSGFGFWSHDIGGFEGTPDPAVFKRWVAFGLLSSHSRLHGSSSYRVPWAFDDEAVEITRAFTRLKLSLMPYLGSSGLVAHRTGLPVMRPLVVDFAHDRSAALVDTQYLLGDALLVAPVFSAEGDTEFYLPAALGGARWTNWWDGSTLPGGTWHRETHGFDTLPLYVRPGSVVPVGGRDDRPDYDWAEGVVLRVFEPGDGLQRDLSLARPDGSEVGYRVERHGDTLTISSDDAPAGWGAALGCNEAVRESGGRVTISLALADRGDVPARTTDEEGA